MQNGYPNHVGSQSLSHPQLRRTSVQQEDLFACTVMDRATIICNNAKNGYRSDVAHIFPNRLQVSDLGKWTENSVDFADMGKLLQKDTSRLIFQSESTTIPMLTVLIVNEEISAWCEANSLDNQAEIAYLEVLSNTLSSRLI